MKERILVSLAYAAEVIRNADELLHLAVIFRFYFFKWRSELQRILPVKKISADLNDNFKR
jgi:hypothetical protein